MVDVLAFSPHPDDAEIGCGGILLKLKDLGYTTGIIDMTRGEMASNGTPEERDSETAEAARILKLDVRENLDLGDCKLDDTYEMRLKVAESIRSRKPRLIFAPYYEGTPGRGLGHNDHLKTGILVSHGANYAHLEKLPIAGEPHSAKLILYYHFPHYFQPSVVFDVTPYFEGWMDAIKCHKSQFGDNLIFVEFIQAFATRYSRYTFTKYTQGFISPAPVVLNDPILLTAQIPER